eukprot:15477422-Alexandrium_andersonii.AAC.1
MCVRTERALTCLLGVVACLPVCVPDSFRIAKGCNGIAMLAPALMFLAWLFVDWNARACLLVFRLLEIAVLVRAL